jgi:hypothetical protein
MLLHISTNRHESSVEYIVCVSCVNGLVIRLLKPPKGKEILMYFIVSWDISASEPQWSPIDEKLRNCFKNYPHIRPVNTFYLVKVSNGDQYNQIHDCFLQIAKTSTLTVFFVMSPLLTSTGWKGWLPQDRWDKISNITS